MSTAQDRANRAAAPGFAALLACVLWACAGPPSTTPGIRADASAGGDAMAVTSDARVAGDAAPVDARSGDAGPVDAAPVDALAGNPLGIAFTDITDLVGDYLGGRINPDPWGMGSGAAVGDVDGDGALEVFLARCDSLSPPGGPSLLLRNQTGALDHIALTGDPQIAAAFAGTCARSAAFGDYDRDGNLDLFVATDGPDRLYRNDGTGELIDASAAAGITGPIDDRASSSYFVDVDRDGMLDLLVLAHVATSPPALDPRNANRLYINQGDGTFVEAGEIARIAGNGSSLAAAIADLDDDGELEIYLANDRYAIDGSGGYPALDPDQWLDPTSFATDGIPVYTDRGADYQITGLRSSMGVSLADIDGDGRDDVVVSDWGSNHVLIWDPAAEVYDDRAAEWNLDLPRNAHMHYQVSWATELTDLDRDGDVELMLVNGSVYDPLSCSAWTQTDRFLRRPEPSAAFVDITTAVGLPPEPECPPLTPVPMAGRGLVLADLDGDGDDDMLVTPFSELYRFYRNDTPQANRHRLRIVPRGTVSAPTPYGAVLAVRRPDGVIVKRTLYAGGTLAQRSHALEAGLDIHTTVVEATLYWPSGYVQRLDLDPGFLIDTTWSVVEPAWLTVTARAVTSQDPPPVIQYRPVDTAGAFLGPQAAGRTVLGTRSDGVALAFTDHGDGSYSAELPHPGAACTIVVTMSDSGTALGPRLRIRYK